MMVHGLESNIRWSGNRLDSKRFISFDSLSISADTSYQSW